MLRNQRTSQIFLHVQEVAGQWRIAPRARRLVLQLSIVLTLMSVLTVVVQPSSARAWYANNQNDCSALAPNPAPNNVPAGWGQALTDPRTGGVARWSWDAQRYIVACNNKGVASASYNGIASLSGGHDQYAPPYSPQIGSQTKGYGAAFQCVELVLRYAFARWNDNPSSWNNNASGLWYNHPSHFAAYADGGQVAPAVGDIVIYGPADSLGNPQPSWGNGHTGIIASINWTKTNGYPTVWIFEQNVGSTYGFHQEYLNALHVDATTYYSLGYNTWNLPQWGNGPGGTDMLNDSAHVVYGWMRG